jgi:gas vesicle protein
MSYDKEEGSGMLLGLAVGLVTGAALTMIYTPRTGSELRDDIRKRGEKLPSELEATLGEVQDLYAKLSNLLRDTATQQTGRLREFTEQAQQEIGSRFSRKQSDDQAAPSDSDKDQ